MKIQGFKNKLVCGIMLSALVLSAYASPVYGNVRSTAAQPLRVSAAIEPTSAATLADVNLSIPRRFAITRPTEKITTTYASYFITGTSDPSQPLYYGNTEIERLGGAGTFGVYVDLEMGENTFTFSQGGESRRVTIVRKAAAGASTVSEIRQSSMYPSVSAGVKVGEKLSVGCIAPAGATVTASFAGNSVTLRQAADAKQGIPAVFKGSIPVDSAPSSDTTEKVGPVTYTLSYNGSKSTYTSTGDVYVAGEKSYIAVRVTSYIGFLYPKTSNVAVFREKLKAGATDYIRSQDDEYYELATGGFIPKSQVEVLEGKIAVGNKLSAVTPKNGEKYESYTFAGTRKPVYYTGLKDGVFTLILYNTKGTPGINVDGGRLFSNVSVSQNDYSVTYTFTLRNPSLLWGYDVQFNGSDTVLRFKYKPALSQSSHPFEGLTILLDPGLGVAGKSGPAEKDVNLAHAIATKDALTEMGAKVYMARYEDMFVSLDDRLKMIEEVDADLFISLHHNSLGENTDANKIAGMELYYHDPLSKRFSDSIMSSLSQNLNRNNRGVKQSYYRVTLLPYAPSILVELGFMTNPLEYERAATPAQIKQVAQALASGIRRSLQ